MPVFTKDRRNILFIHIPKTAGTTIEKTFSQSGYRLSYRRGKGNPLNQVTRCTPQHLHGEMLEMLFNLSRFDTIFTTVRHPYDRFRSEYAMLRKSPNMYGSNMIEKWLKQKLNAYKENPFVNDNHFRPQVDFLVPGTQVYKLEDGLDRLFTSLREKNDIETIYDENTSKYMVSKRLTGMSSSDVEINDRVKDLLHIFYMKDFSQFEYEKY